MCLCVCAVHVFMFLASFCSFSMLIYANGDVYSDSIHLDTATEYLKVKSNEKDPDEWKFQLKHYYSNTKYFFFFFFEYDDKQNIHAKTFDGS